MNKYSLVNSIDVRGQFYQGDLITIADLLRDTSETNYQHHTNDKGQEIDFEIEGGDLVIVDSLVSKNIIYLSGSFESNFENIETIIQDFAQVLNSNQILFNLSIEYLDEDDDEIGEEVEYYTDDFDKKYQVYLGNKTN